MSARNLAEDFHWFTDGDGSVLIAERWESPQGEDDAMLYRVWPESEAPDFCFEPEPTPEPKFQVGQWVGLRDLCDIIMNLLPMAENGATRTGPGHICGPEGNCDMLCVNAARDGDTLARAKKAVAQMRKGERNE